MIPLPKTGNGRVRLFTVVLQEYKYHPELHYMQYDCSYTREILLLYKFQINAQLYCTFILHKSSF